MPSTKNPVLVVLPGPGKLPAGTVSASALMFPPGGGSGAALEAHITDPIDAHMASAIGINPYDSYGFPILASVGGPVDGESVLDFIDGAKDLFPVRPDVMGVDSPSVPNSGIPSWDVLDLAGVGVGESITGGFKRGSNVIYTHHLVHMASGATIEGMVYPADRGVLAFYHTSTGDYTTGTLISALWLGSVSAPSGIPSALFLEASRQTQQSDHSTGSGIDKFFLQFRVPYLKDYSPYPGVLWANFDDNFYRYQIADYASDISVISPGDNGSWLVAHWKESYATSLASIQPAQLATHFSSTYCYSSTTPDFDTVPVFTINRHNVFRDTISSSPSGSSFTTAVHTGLWSTTELSGVTFYHGVLRWDLTLHANGLFNTSFFTGTTSDVVNGPPSNMLSAVDPVSLDLSDFGFVTIDYRFSQLQDSVSHTLYSTSHAPQTTDTGELVVSNLATTFVSSASPIGGYGIIKSVLRKPFTTYAVYADTIRYLYNSFPQTGSTASTDTFEPFCDEKYRYITTYDPTDPAVPILPAGGNDYNSTAVITTSDHNAQVIGNQLVYPSVNFSVSPYKPVGNPNYAAVLSGDAVHWIRRHIRAFDTGVARNTGKIRIRGAGGFTQFESSVPWTGNEVTDHPGGLIVQIRVPGATGWLDVGRTKGDPDLGTEDFKGCRTGLEISGSDVIVTYDTTAYTVDSGPANGHRFLLFVRVGYVRSVGTGSPIDEIEWMTP